MRIISVLFALLLSACGEQTVEVMQGAYGPFSIGDGKADVLGKLETITGIMQIEPVPFDDTVIDSPTEKSIRSLDDNNGILIWLDHHPFPLRIEINDGIVNRKWGELPCSASMSRMNDACRELGRLSSTIGIGTSRIDVYSAILSFDTQLSKQVGRFIVGHQDFRTGKNNSESEFRDLILSADAWQFEGLKDLSKFHNPYYSRVTLYFTSGKLSKIKHWSAQNEML